MRKHGVAACSTFHFAKELSMTSLRQRMTEDMQVRNLALNTQTCYVQQVSLFARHFDKSPEQLGPEDIRAYQVYLTNEKKLAPGSILIAVAALRFLYKVSLKKGWRFEGDVSGQPINRSSVELACQKARRLSGIRKPITPIRCGTDSPFIYWNPARMYGPSNCCSATAAWRPRLDTCGSPPAKSV